MARQWCAVRGLSATPLRFRTVACCGASGVPTPLPDGGGVCWFLFINLQPQQRPSCSWLAAIIRAAPGARVEIERDAAVGFRHVPQPLPDFRLAR